jgi:integrase
MNMVDIIHLKPENIDESFLSFVREKTKRTKKKNLTPTKVALNERAISIIEKYKTIEKGKKYLFPVLENCKNPQAVKNKTQGFIKKINAGMETIRLRLEIGQKLNTYSARHSYCSRLMRMGVSAEYLRESFDHSSVLVTQNYMGDFEDKVKTEYANLLVNIK